MAGAVEGVAPLEQAVAAAVWQGRCIRVQYESWKGLQRRQLAPLGLAPENPSEPHRLQAQIKPEPLRLLTAPKGQPAPEPAPASPERENQP